MTRRDPVVVAWVAGLAVAALIYVMGPDDVLYRLQAGLGELAWRVSNAVAHLSMAALDVVRALAIGLYATFLVLAVGVARRGGRSRVAAVVVSIVFFMLVDGAAAGAQARWAAALIVSGAGAAVMTGRLRQGAVVLRA